MLTSLIASALIATATPLPYDPAQRIEPHNLPNVHLVFNGTRITYIHNRNNFSIKCYIGLKAGNVWTKGYLIKGQEYAAYNNMIFRFGFCVDAREEASRGTKL